MLRSNISRAYKATSPGVALSVTCLPDRQGWQVWMAIFAAYDRARALIFAAVTGKIDVRCNIFESGAQDAVATLS
ncbi:MAG: hypothetical protein PHP85_09565 [Gallionella sp.]|nr:hypothetical protein [Gallionella sp.]